RDMTRHIRWPNFHDEVSRRRLWPNAAVVNRGQQRSLGRPLLSTIADGPELGLSPRTWQRSEAERCLAGATVARPADPSPASVPVGRRPADLDGRAVAQDDGI